MREAKQAPEREKRGRYVGRGRGGGKRGISKRTYSLHWRHYTGGGGTIEEHFIATGPSSFLCTEWFKVGK